MTDPNTFIFIDKEAFELDKKSNLGQLPKQRPIQKYINRGFVILDKPAGPTSHDVVATVKKILDVDKAGHSGTLDPGVSGILPIGIADGTKILSQLSGATKRYICNLKLEKEVNYDKLQEVINEFTGQIYQFPPLKSNVVRKLRKRTIYSMELLDQNGSEYLLDITCEAGTYIRTLCIDMGKILGVGGKMKELRRVKSAHFIEKDTVTLHDLFDAYQDAIEGLGDDKLKTVIQPIEDILIDTPKVVIRNNAVSSFSHGAKLAYPGILGYQKFNRNEEVQIITCKGELVGLGSSLCSSDQLKDMTSGFVIQPNRIIFDRSEYPQ